MSKSGGKDFVHFLKEIECPHVKGLESRDLDWLWETPAAPLMDWICKNVTVENLLTEHEAVKWRAIPLEDRLQGPKLQEALAHLDKEDVAANDRENLEHVREELDALETCIAELKHIKASLNNHQGRLSLMLNDLNSKLNSAEANLSGGQKSLLRLNADFNSAMEKLKETIKTALSPPKETSSISEADLSSLIKENDHVAKMICALIHKRFAAGNEIRGRDVEEFEALVAEVHRLRFSLQKSEEKRIINEAKCRGAREGLDETKSQLMLLSNDMLPKSPDLVQNEIQQTEKEIQALQCQIKGLIHESLPKSIEQKIARHSSKILAEDLQCKVDRQRYVASQLNIVLDLLLELTSCQEALGVALEQEENSLKELEGVLEKAKAMEKDLMANHEKNESKCKLMLEKEASFKRNTLVPWDKSLLSLHKLLTDRDIDPSLITYEDLTSLMEKLEKSCKSDQDQLQSLTENWIIRRDKICSLLKQMLAEINITGMY